MATLQLWDEPPVAASSAALRSTGVSFWWRVLEWLGGGEPVVAANASSASFLKPVTVTVSYTNTLLTHLDTEQLSLYHWDGAQAAWQPLTSTVDAVGQSVSAQTTAIGHFDLQAPLLCPSDNLEPNDNYDSASAMAPGLAPVSSTFDIAQDEDWFAFEAHAGCVYKVETTGLVAGVATVAELLDVDGSTVLAVDDGDQERSSHLQWQSPRTGIYFVRISQSSGSVHGCDASYRLGVEVRWELYLPLVLRQR
jgi:hypothetical protein